MEKTVDFERESMLFSKCLNHIREDHRHDPFIFCISKNSSRQESGSGNARGLYMGLSIPGAFVFLGGA